jgi:hypothetical protein
MLSLITPGSDHTLVLEPHMVLKSTLDVSRIITSLTWDVKTNSKNLGHISVTVDILFKY